MHVWYDLHLQLQMSYIICTKLFFQAVHVQTSQCVPAQQTQDQRKYTCG